MKRHTYKAIKQAKKLKIFGGGRDVDYPQFKPRYPTSRSKAGK